MTMLIYKSFVKKKREVSITYFQIFFMIASLVHFDEIVIFVKIVNLLILVSSPYEIQTIETLHLKNRGAFKLIATEKSNNMMTTLIS